jgi:hypothetical protein
MPVGFRTLQLVAASSMPTVRVSLGLIAIRDVQILVSGMYFQTGTSILLPYVKYNCVVFSMIACRQSSTSNVSLPNPVKGTPKVTNYSSLATDCHCPAQRSSTCTRLSQPCYCSRIATIGKQGGPCSNPNKQAPRLRLRFPALVKPSNRLSGIG